MNPLPLAEAYLNFRKLTSALEAMPGFEAFDANHKALFEVVVMHWSQGNPLTVQDTIGQTALGSPATLHKRLQNLIAQDLVKSDRVGTDLRAKFVSPTDKGLKYADWVGEKLIKSLTPTK
jgi:DNA-binding MarR family transcriptional regulator